MRYLSVIIMIIALASANASDSLKIYTGAKDSLLDYSGIYRHDLNPVDVVTMRLAGDGHTLDTVPVNCHNVIGPIPLVRGRDKPMYKAMMLNSQPLVGGSAPIGEIRFQTTPTYAISDTLSGHWVVADTVADTTTTTGNLGSRAYVKFETTNIGNFVWFDFHNYDTAAVVFNTEVTFIGSETYKNKVLK